MAKIKGKWQWDSEVSSSGVFYEEISFTSNGEEFRGITVEAFTATARVLAYITKEWGDYVHIAPTIPSGPGAFQLYEQYRIMDFGASEQEVSEEFYNYLDANATQITTCIVDLASITTKKHRVDGEAEISTQVDKNGFSYVHIATNDDTTVTTITAENVPVGKIMFFKYRLCSGYYPAGHLGVSVYYKHDGIDKLAVGTRNGGVPNFELAKRHRGWVVGRVNAEGELGRQGLWTNDATLVVAESIKIEIAHKDDLDIAYFITDNYNANLMPIVKEYGDEYYMHQYIEFGRFLDNQWRKINDTMDDGVKQTDPFTPPHLPEHPEEGDPVYYTLEFDLNGHGDGTDLSVRTIKKGKNANKPDNPTIEGYELKFRGWYTDAECTNEYDFSTPVTCDLVLYAKWTELTIAEKLQLIAENLPKVYDALKGGGLPTITTEDNGKIIEVADGAYVLKSLEESSVKTYIDEYINSALGGDY